MRFKFVLSHHTLSYHKEGISFGSNETLGTCSNDGADTEKERVKLDIAGQQVNVV